MKVAIINEVSACGRNPDLLRAAEGFGLEIANVGMVSPGQTPPLIYLHTGVMAALLLNTGAADFVIGGCGTGQGFLTPRCSIPAFSAASSRSRWTRGCFPGSTTATACRCR